MQAGLGGGSADAAATLLALGASLGWRAVAADTRRRGGHRRGRRLLPVGGNRTGPRTRRGDLPAGRFTDALGGRRPAAVRHFDCRSVLLVRRGSGCRRARASRAADAARSVADPRGADDQRSRAAGRAPSSRRLAPSRPSCARPGPLLRRCLAAGPRFLACFAHKRPPPGRSSRVSRSGARARLTRTLSRAEHERRARPVATKSRSV